MRDDRRVEVSPGAFKDAQHLTPQEQAAAAALEDEMQVMKANLAENLRRLESSPDASEMRPPLATMPPLADLTYWETRHVLALVSVWNRDISLEEHARLITELKPPDRGVGDLANPTPPQKLFDDFKEADAALAANPDSWDAFFAYEEASRKFSTRLDLLHVLEESARRERERDGD